MGRGLHVLMGARFEHAHDQCLTCRHRSADGGVPGFDGYCVKKEKTLCCSTRARCRSFEPSEGAMPRTTKSSVHGANYVMHIQAGQLTLCGRPAARVNCHGPNDELNEVTCRACAKARAKEEHDRQRYSGWMP